MNSAIVVAYSENLINIWNKNSKKPIYILCNKNIEPSSRKPKINRVFLIIAEKYQH